MKISWPYMEASLFGVSVLFYCSVYLSLCYYCPLFTVALQNLRKTTFVDIALYGLPYFLEMLAVILMHENKCCVLKIWKQKNKKSLKFW